MNADLIPEFTRDATFRDLLDPAMDIAKSGDRDMAAEYVRQYIGYLVNEWGRTPQDAENVVRVNVGYYAGYCDSETRQAVYEVFRVEHPYFGTSTPTTAQAFNIGKLVGEAAKAKRDGAS